MTDRHLSTPAPVTTDPTTGQACTHADRVGWEVRGTYDGVLWWTCPACGAAWPRFPPGHHLHELGAAYARGERP